MRRDAAASVSLTPRQAEILRLLTNGYRPVEIAERLDLSQNTIESHIRGLCRRAGVRSRAQVTQWGTQHGFR